MNKRQVSSKSILAAFFHSITFAVMVSPAQGFASEIEELRNLRDSTVTLMNLMVRRGLLSKEDVAPIVEQAKRSEVASKEENAQPGTSQVASANNPNVIRVPLVPEFMKDEMRDEIKQEVLQQAKQERWGEPGALPGWLSRLSFDGDIRLRYQRDTFPDDNVPNAAAVQFIGQGQNVTNTTETRDRERVRLRLGINANISEHLKAGIRFVTGGVGSGSDPNSSNQTLGNYSAHYTIGIDRAFINYKPNSWLEVNAGRIVNPFFAPTELVWSETLSLEGAAVKITPTLSKRIQPFVTIGGFPIESIDPTPNSVAKSKWMYGYQAGVNWDMGSDYKLKLAASFYDYQNVEGIPNATLADVSAGKFNATAPAFTQKGNTIFDINQVNVNSPFVGGLASKFQEFNLSGSLDISNIAGKTVKIDGDYVRNFGYDRQEILARTGVNVEEAIDGYQMKLTLGDPSVTKYGDWQAYTGFRYVQANAVLDAFTDNDFHLGGTNAKGYFLGGRLGVEKSSFVNARWLSSKEVSGLPLAIDVLQVDFVSSF